MMYREGLLEQEVVYEQFDNVPPETPPSQVLIDPGGAITGLSSNTLTVGGKTGTIQNIEAPQAIGTGANVNFNTVNVTNKPTTRTNLGLGGLATQNAAAASADTAPAQSGVYVQADVQAILNELRDLKSKLRSAGILSP
jgi:hypothetical protein